MRTYITKLNDRNLQRRKATGITNYVMYSLIVLILFKIFSTVPKISAEIDIWNLTKVLWYSFNFSFASYFIYFSFTYSFNNSSSIRILNYSKDNESYFIKIIAALILLSPTIPACFIFWNDYTLENLQYSRWEKLLFILDAINIIFVIVMLVSQKNDHFDIIKHTKKEKDNKLSLIVLIISSFAIFSSIYLLINLSEINELDKLNLFLVCILIFSILVITERIIENFKEDVFAKDLENLEYEIYVKNLTDDEIREILQKKYMGFLIKDWIEHKEKEIEIENSSFTKESEKISAKETDIKEIDKEKYPIEYEGRKDEIELLKTNLKNKKQDFHKNNISQLKEIIKKDPSLSENDIKNLKNLLQKLTSTEKS